jgi:hypothetical protein
VLRQPGATCTCLKGLNVAPDSPAPVPVQLSLIHSPEFPDGAMQVYPHCVVAPTPP